MQARHTWQAWGDGVQWFTWSRLVDILYKNRCQRLINKIGLDVYMDFCLKILTDIGLAALIQGGLVNALLCLEFCMRRFAASLQCDCISLSLHKWSILAVWSFAWRWWRKALFSASCILTCMRSQVYLSRGDVSRSVDVPFANCLSGQFVFPNLKWSQFSIPHTPPQWCDKMWPLIPCE